MEVSWEILGYHWTMKNQIRHAKLSYADSAFRRELSSGTNTKGLKTIQPYIFSMNILANSGHVPMDFIQEYLMSKTGENVEGQSNLYRGLLEVLKSQKSGRGAKVQNNQTSRSVMLL